jgi:hypothetical protein
LYSVTNCGDCPEPCSKICPCPGQAPLIIQLPPPTQPLSFSPGISAPVREPDFMMV